MKKFSFILALSLVSLLSLGFTNPEEHNPFDMGNVKEFVNHNKIEENVKVDKNPQTEEKILNEIKGTKTNTEEVQQAQKMPKKSTRLILAFCSIVVLLVIFILIGLRLQ